MPSIPSIRAWKAVILAIDTARISGWAIWARGKCLKCGEVDMLKDSAAVAGLCLESQLIATAAKLPSVLIYERPFRGTAQGQWIGSWKAAWHEVGGSPRRTRGVYPATWYARVLGFPSLKRDAARRLQQAIAGQIMGENVGPDASAAVCIGKWASHATEVAKVLPKGAATSAGSGRESGRCLTSIGLGTDGRKDDE